MRDLFQSLTRHVGSLTRDGFETLLESRPDVEAVLFADVPDGAEPQVDVHSVVEALADPDGVAETMVRMTRPEIQVLMALSASADAIGGGVADRFGGLGFDELMRVGVSAGAGRTGRVELIRLLASHSTPLEIDPRAACEDLCRPLAREAQGLAEAEFERILRMLGNACLVWRESEDGPLRLHDVVPDLLPEPAAEWDVFDPFPPVPEVARRLPVENVDAEAQAAAMIALECAERLLRQVAAQTVPLLKAGGVGSREIKRLARTCGLEEEAIRFWLHIAEGAELVACLDGKLLATPHYDEWLHVEPDLRYAALFTAWMDLPTSVLGPFAAGDRSGRTPAALSETAFDGVGHHVRGEVLDLMTAGGAGTIAGPASLARALLWRMPLLLAPEPECDCACAECQGPPTSAPAYDEYQNPATNSATAAVTTVLIEGTVLGAVALGASAPAVRALFGAAAAAPPDTSAVAADFASALAGTLPATTHRVRVQGDMTVVATGLPSAKLTAFLDAAADRESAGAATVWRITDSSVRRWLDSGRPAEELLAGFAEACDDELPQPLRYLIADAARRHGLVDVIGVRAVVVAADAALGAELTALPALAGLGVRRVADTVLVADAAPSQVLEALRSAGYLPSAHNADGSLTVANGPAPRAGS